MLRCQCLLRLPCGMLPQAKRHAGATSRMAVSAALLLTTRASKFAPKGNLHHLRHLLCHVSLHSCFLNTDAFPANCLRPLRFWHLSFEPLVMDGKACVTSLHADGLCVSCRTIAASSSQAPCRWGSQGDGVPNLPALSCWGGRACPPALSVWSRWTYNVSAVLGVQCLYSRRDG